MKYSEKNESILEAMQKFFYDNIKVKWNERLATNFVYWGRGDALVHK